jgi:hypothetical protein
LAPRERDKRIRGREIRTGFNKANYCLLLRTLSTTGSDIYVKEAIRDQVAKAAFNMFKARELNDFQSELLLLRCCSGEPKLIYWMRTCDPAVTHEQIAYFDNIIDSSLQHILGSPVCNKDRLAMHIPLSMGGRGIPIAALSAESAFVASVGASWHLQPNVLPRFGFSTAKAKLISLGVSVPELLINGQLEVVSPLLSNLKEFSQKKFMLIINAKMREDIQMTGDIKKDNNERAKLQRGQLLAYHST